MPLTWREHTLHMKWCLDCHRNPEQHIRPREQVFSMTWKPENEGKTQAQLGAELVEKYHVRRAATDEDADPALAQQVNKLTNCSVCHR